MFFNKYIQFSFIIIFSLFRVSAQEQEKPKTTFRMFVDVGGGYSYRLNDQKLPIGTSLRDGIAGTFRLKWGSSNLLGVGIETGWLPISSMSVKNLSTEFGAIDLSASLSAIPVLAIFSIQRLGLQLHSGIGYYRVTAKSTVMGTSMESSEWKLGFLLSLGYGRPLTPDYRVGVDVKWNNIVEHQTQILSVQLRLMYKIFGV